LLTKINKNITFFHLLNLQGRPAGGGRWRSELAGVGVGRGRAAARAHHEPEAGSRPGAGGGAVLQAGGGRRRGAAGRGRAAARWAAGAAGAAGAVVGGSLAASWNFSSRAKLQSVSPRGRRASFIPGTKGLGWGFQKPGPLVPVCGTDRD
jgi:hypothetical protein